MNTGTTCEAHYTRYDLLYSSARIIKIYIARREGVKVRNVVRRILRNKDVEFLKLQHFAMRFHRTEIVGRLNLAPAQKSYLPLATDLCSAERTRPAIAAPTFRHYGEYRS
ncbi:hypothetical protein EVAR_98941_1 [Eumeta japonica]|uniref:Uncharacterized protein n=1 Tax=Eumeta variegata TaxID=151549 RepID=A0A4C1STN8_EUMVA|nr:hypothetical protein EVAR_98941_1 [Eumeta japonica]